jgi:hypothetical protein
MIQHIKLRRIKVLIAFISVLIIFNLFTVNNSLAYTKDEANTSIQQADEAAASAFKIVLEAEKVGANVSRLITKMNEAAVLLTNAKIMAYKENFHDTIELANSSIEIANSVKYEAINLKISTLSLHDYIFKISIIESLFGVTAFLLSMIFLWRWFKSYYAHKILGLKPEVAENVDT